MKKYNQERLLRLAEQLQKCELADYPSGNYCSDGNPAFYLTEERNWEVRCFPFIYRQLAIAFPEAWQLDDNGVSANYLLNSELRDEKALRHFFELDNKHYLFCFTAHMKLQQHKEFETYHLNSRSTPKDIASDIYFLQDTYSKNPKRRVLVEKVLLLSELL